MAAPSSERQSTPDMIDDILDSFYAGETHANEESGLVIDLTSEEEDGELYDLYGDDFEDNTFTPMSDLSMEDLSKALHNAMLRAFPEDVSTDEEDDNDPPLSPATPSPYAFTYDHEQLGRKSASYFLRSSHNDGIPESPITPRGHHSFDDELDKYLIEAYDYPAPWIVESELTPQSKKAQAFVW